MVEPRTPKWIIISAYVGRKQAFKGLFFRTRHTYFQKKLAVSMADKLNSKVSKWPGHDFEFQVVPYEEAA